jgi:hypothetical protein
MAFAAIYSLNTRLDGIHRQNATVAGHRVSKGFSMYLTGICHHV